MGLGWPRPARGGTSPLGWPRQKSNSGDETARSEPEDAGHVRQEEIRPDSAPPVSRETTTAAEGIDVSRETPIASLTDVGAVSRETDAGTDAEPEEGHPVDVGEPVAPATPSWPAGPWPLPDAARIIGVANQKGGVGKTTSTVNLSVALAQHGARVLVVDLDPQGNSSTAFSVEHREGTPSIYDVLVHGRDLSEVAAPVDGVPLLYCAPATIDLAGAEIELVSMVAREMRLSKALAAAAADYDYVFIDCPPSLGLLTVNALVAAREVLIPIQCEFYALEGLSQLLRNIELVRAHLNPSLHVSTILLTMYDARTRLAEQVADEVRNHFGPVVLAESIPRSVRISEAPGYGQSVMTYDPGSRGARAYARAAYELAQRAQTEEGTAS